MSSRTLVPVVALLLVVGGIAAWLLQSEEGSTSGALSPGARESVPVASADPVDMKRPATTTDVDDPAPRRAAPQSEPATTRAARVKSEDGDLPRVAGRVVDRFGGPIEGARVRILRSGMAVIVEDGRLRQTDPGEAITGADGRFEIDGVEPGTLRVFARASGFAPFEKRQVAVPAGAGHDLGDLVLSQGAILSGRVVDANGRPVAGAELNEDRDRVTLTHEPFMNMHREPLAVTDVDGNFRIEEMACGLWRIVVSSERAPSGIFEGRADVPGAETGGLEFRLPEGAEIAGRVIGVPSDEVSNLIVRARPVSGDADDFFAMSRRDTRTARLGAGGSFVVEGLGLEREYDLQVRQSHDAGHERSMVFLGGGSRSDSVRAETGDRGVELYYNLGATLTFVVEDARTGEPITEMEIASGLDWPMPLRGDDGRMQREFPEGQVEVTELFPRTDKNTFLLRINATGYAEWERDDIALEPGQSLDLGTIRLEPVPVVVVTVLDDSTGAPVPNARVSLRKQSPAEFGGGGSFRMEMDVSIGGDGEEVVDFGGSGRHGRTDENGVAVLTSLEGETCTLKVESDEFAVARVENLELPRGRRVERELRLRRGGAVLVHVVDPEGAPLPGVRVEHRAPTDDPGMMFFSGVHGAEDMTDAEGVMVFEHLEPGVHSFRIQEGGGGSFFGDGEAVVMLHGAPQTEETPWTEIAVAEGKTGELTLEAAPRGTIEGRVRESGVPLAGASLVLKKRTDPVSAGSGPGGFDIASMLGGGGPTTTTDGDGYYSFEGVKPGEYTLEITHPERVLPADRDLELEENGSLALRFDVELPVSMIEGRITDTAGTPIEGAEVWVERTQSGPGAVVASRFIMIQDDTTEGFSVGGGPSTERTRSGNDGFFRLRGVPEDASLVVKASSPYHEESESETVELTADEVLEGVDISLEGAGRLDISIAGPDGSPSGMCMVIANYEGQGVEPRREFVGPAGRLELSGLRPGTWLVGANSLEAGFGATPSLEPFEVTLGETESITLAAP